VKRVDVKLSLAAEDLRRDVARRLKHQLAHELSRLAASRIERERASGGLHGRLAFALAIAGRERGASGLELGLGELLAQRDVAIAIEELLHGVAELARGRVTIASFTLRRAHADRIKLGRHVGLVHRGARVDRSDRHLSRRGSALVQWSECEQFEQDAAERVDIGATIEFLAAEQVFGRHVARGAEERAGTRAAERGDIVELDTARRDDDARDAPVEDVDLAEVAEHDVRRLEVAVNDAAGVRELDRETDIDERAQVLSPLRGRVGSCECRGQRGAGEPLHHEERVTVFVVLELVNRDDRRVFEPTLNARFAQEALDRLGRRVLVTQSLDRHRATDLVIVPGDHLAHAADAENLREPVARQRSADRRRRAVSGRRHLACAGVDRNAVLAANCDSVCDPELRILVHPRSVSRHPRLRRGTARWRSIALMQDRYVRLATVDDVPAGDDAGRYKQVRVAHISCAAEPPVFFVS
jgi:hypothetical protein